MDNDELEPVSFDTSNDTSRAFTTTRVFGDRIRFASSANNERNLRRIQQMVMDQMYVSSFGYYVDTVEDFTPDPEKHVDIGEEDTLPVNYDIDDEAEKKSLPENKSFYANTKGKLSEVAKIYNELVDELSKFIAKDKFFIENGLLNTKIVEMTIVHPLWSIYRVIDKNNNPRNAFPKDITILKESIINTILNSMYLKSYPKANTYIHKNMEEIASITSKYFDRILGLGNIKLNPRSATCSIVVNNTTYTDVLNERGDKKIAPASRFVTSLGL